jgi:hypothetical protein
MPVMVFIEPNPDFKGDDAKDKAVFETVKKRGAIEVDQVTAAENIRLSKGMYRIRPEAKAPAEVKPLSFETMSSEEIKLMALAQGMKVTADKAVKRSEMIAFLEARLAKVEVVDD